VVVRRLGAREAYLASLVEMARIGVRARALPAAPFLGKSHLRERVDLLLKEVVMSRVRTQIHVAVSAAAILLAIAWAVSAAPLQSAKAPAPAAIEAARFSTIEGGVQVKFVGTTEWVGATQSQVLRADDLVRTGPGASAEIRFADGTLLAVRPNSVLQIEGLAPNAVPVSTRSAEDKADAAAPKLVHKVNPVYPADAKAEKVEGMFQLAVVVGKDGAVRDARVVASSSTPGRLDDPKALNGDPRLAKAAVEAVQAWRYEPILKNGQPVEAKMTISVNFKLS
jgi:TonB family protein